MSVGTWLDSLLGNQQQEQQQPPPASLLGGDPGATQDGIFGMTRPQVPSYEQFRQNQNSLPGILGAFAHGTLPGLAQLAGGDQNSQAAMYNQLLGQGQQVELGRLGLPKAQFISDAYGQAMNGGQGGGQTAAGQANPTAPYGAPQSSFSGDPNASGAELRPMAQAQQGAQQPSVQNGGLDRFGNPLLPGLTPNQQLLMPLVDPVGYKARVDAYWADHRGGSTYRDPATGQTQMAPQGLPGVPGVPGQQGYNQNAEALKTAQERPAFNFGQAAANEAYTRQTGQKSPAGRGGVAVQNLGGANQGQIPSGASAPPQGRGGDIQTPSGTVVPAPTQQNQTMGPGSDLIDKQNTESIATEKNWNNVRPAIETSRQRLMASAQVFQQVQGNGLNEHKAEIANNLRGIPGMGGIADMIMSGGDTAAVKTAIWNSMQETLAGLKAINAGTGGRILNSEFNAFMEHGFSANMPAATLNKAITAQLGTTFQVGQMIDDYYGTGRKAGWRDANQFQSAYLQKNPVEKFVDYAEKSIGPFKGQSGGPGSPVKALDNGTRADANNAIMRGAPRAAVMKRLQDNGYDTSGF